MYLSNPVIVLVTSYILKDENNITTYKRLQEFLPLEKSQISQALKNNEDADLIKKLQGKKYFSTIQITPNGIQKAQRYISFLEKLIKTSPSNLPKHPKSILYSSTPSPNLNSFGDKLTTSLFSPLKSTLKKSLQNYIPESHLPTDMLEDITDETLSFFQRRLENYEK